MTIQIVAELAQGFEGRSEQARLLLKAAAVAGADAAKYQLVYADELATPNYKYYGLFRSLEMPDETWQGLAAYARELGILLHLDIFGSRSLRLAEQIGVGTIKLHGTDIANMGLLGEVANSSIGKVFLGAGGAYLNEIERAIATLSNKEVVVLLGFQGYPTPNETNQITRVRHLVERFRSLYPQVSIGFADHAPPTTPLRHALAAVAVGAGAKVLEKHLTLGKVMMLEDHESALNPDEFQEFSEVVRNCAQAMGAVVEADDFGMSEAEATYRKMIRRHVVASRDLAVGAKIVPSDLVLKRTSAEQVITDIGSAYQKTINRDLKTNEPLLLTDIDQ